MEDTIEVGNRGDFDLWAIEVAKQIVSEQGFELAKAARDGSEDDVRAAGNGLGQAITTPSWKCTTGFWMIPPTAKAKISVCLSEGRRRLTQGRH